MPSHLDFSQGCTAIDDLTHCSACACGYMRPPSKGWFLGWLSGARGDRVPSGHISQSPSRPPIRRSRDTVRHGPTARWRDHGLPPVFEPERARPTRVPSFSPRLKYTCEPTTHRSVRRVFLPTPHHRAECLWEPPAAAWFGCQLIVQQLVGPALQDAPVQVRRQCPTPGVHDRAEVEAPTLLSPAKRLAQHRDRPGHAHPPDEGHAPR